MNSKTTAYPHPLRLAIISSPRSGNSWLRHLLRTAFALEERVAHSPEALFARPLPPRLILQIHWYPEEMFLRRLEQEGIRIITLARHPLDVLLSVLHFIQHEPETANWLAGAGKIDFSMAGQSPNSRDFVGYATGDGAKALIGVTREWWRRPDPVKIRYEDLLNDSAFHFGCLVGAIGQDPMLPIEEVLRLNPMSKLKNTRNHHAWQGRPGLWRELMLPSTALMISRAHRESFSVLGYDCIPDATLDEALANQRWQAMRIRPGGSRAAPHQCLWLEGRQET